MVAAGAQARDFGPVTKILEKKNVEYAYPHWSHAGDRILFQSNEIGVWQLYIMDADGGNRVQLTSRDSNNNFPDWSPDDSTICFISDRDGNDEVYVMDADGSHPRRLTTNPAREIHPYWTPDGRHILFNSTRSGHGDLDIYMMNADGSDQKRMSFSHDEETCARLNPAGNRLVYLRNNASGLDDVFMMDVSDGETANVTNTPTRDGWPSWTPSGRGIVFSALKDGVFKLFVLDLDTKKLTQLTDPKRPAFDARANVSSDGTKIVFNRQVSGPRNTVGIYVLKLKEPLP